MAAQQIALQPRVAPNVIAETADELIVVLEAQLGAFRSIYEITSRVRERFVKAGSAVLKEGIHERAAYLERVLELEKKLKELKLQWNAYRDIAAAEHDARISELVDECQKVIGQIVETDRSLHQAATARQQSLQTDLAEMHQRRQPLAAYLATPALSTSYSVPVSGRNVHFSGA